MCDDVRNVILLFLRFPDTVVMLRCLSRLALEKIKGNDESYWGKISRIVRTRTPEACKWKFDQLKFKQLRLNQLRTRQEASDK